MTATARAATFKPANFAASVAAFSDLPGSSALGAAGLVPVGTPTVAPGANVETVGVGKEFSTIAAAVAAAPNGTTILVNAGTYTNDFATITSNITMIGVGGMVNMVATEPPPNYKGILTVDNNATIENFSFSGCAIPDAEGGNGAGIRYEGGDMVLDNDSFSNNQDGIMGSPVLGFASNTVNINDCVFSSNGSGSGYTHNLYIGDVDELTATSSVFEYAVVGHEFKSRALINNISGNVFQDGPTGTASYDIDLPDGGVDTITGNYIEKGPDASNDAMVHFGGEGIPYAGSSLTISGNTFQNDLGAAAVGVLNQTAISATITGNAFSNFQGATIASGPATETGNVDGTGTALPNSTLVGVLPGSTLIITDALAHNVTLTDTLQAVEGGAGFLKVYAQAGHVIAVGGSGGMNFSESPTSGGNSISTAAGSANTIVVVGQDVIDSLGNDHIAAGPDNITGNIGGTANIADGTGNNNWSVVGVANILGQGGNPVISVGSTGSVNVTGTLGYLQISDNGGAARFNITEFGTIDSAAIMGGAVNTIVNAGTMAISTAAGSIGTTLRLGAGAATVTSLGPDTIWAGGGADTVIIEGHATVHAGTGSLAVFGRGSPGATVYGNGGSYSIGGDTGNITYIGGAQASTVTMLLDNNQLLGGFGLLTIIGGSRETIIGGRGGIDYTATDGGGGNSIDTAVGSTNTLDLSAADTVDSWGNDTISGGVGNQTISVHGTATIEGSSGNSNLTIWGNDTLNGVGQDVCAVEAGATLNATAGTLTQVSETSAVVNFWASANGAHAIVTGGGATINNNADGGISVVTIAGDDTRVVIGGGSVAVNANGADVVQAGSGPDTIDITAANTQIVGGSGALTVNDYDWTAGDLVTVHGGTGNLTFDQGPGHLVFIGGAGAATIQGGYGSIDATGGSGQINLTGGSLATNFTAGSGAATVALSSGGGDVTFGTGDTTVNDAGYGAADFFTFAAGQGGGSDVINGLRGGIDQVTFQGVTIATQALSGGGTSLVLSDNTQVLLAGVFDTSNLFKFT